MSSSGECGRGGRGGGGDSGSAARREGRRNWADSVVVRVRREGVSVAILVVVVVYYVPLRRGWGCRVPGWVALTRVEIVVDSETGR